MATSFSLVMRHIPLEQISTEEIDAGVGVTDVSEIASRTATGSE